MIIESFKRRCEFLHRMTVDFAMTVPDEKWDWAPDLPASTAAPDPMRHGEGFAPFNKQLRHVICVRGVYNEAMITKRADFARKHDHYNGALTREALLAAFNEKQRDTLAALDKADAAQPIDFFGRAFSLADLTYTLVQHEAIHHGQWSLYAALAGFETPKSWRIEWGL